MTNFEYFYGIEAEQFTFYRIPKLLFKDERFKGLSSDAKLLYGLMLDRMSLSMKNGWLDENNRVYIYYTVENIMDDLGCAREKCAKVVAELDYKKGIGLIEKKRQGLGKPDKIYVKNFVIQSNKTDIEISKEDAQWQEIRKSKFRKSENQISESTIFEMEEVGKSNANNTDKKDTEWNNTSNLISSDKNDKMDEMAIYEKIIKTKIRYDDLLFDNPVDKDMIVAIYELIFEILISQNEFLVIAGDKYPIQVVKKKFRELNYEHITYILACMKRNTTTIKNIKKYLLASLFNAPTTIDSYYKSWVNNDMPQYV